MDKRRQAARIARRGFRCQTRAEMRALAAQLRRMGIPGRGYDMGRGKAHRWVVRVG